MNSLKNIARMRMSNIAYTIIRTVIVISFLWFTACEETIHLELDQYTENIVIEGLVTNHADYQYVKVSRTAEFYEPDHTPRITDAVVIVTDDLGTVYNFVHNPRDNEDSVGIYVPATPFVGSVGRTYKLHVEVEGEVFEAEDQLLPVTTIDSLGFKIDDNMEEDPEVEGREYLVLLYTQEPQDQTNFYHFKFFRNDSLTFEDDTDIYYSDDEFLAENINGVESPIYFSEGDHCRVEMYSISRVGYVYYNDLSSLLNNDGGGMFGSVPASPRTNLSNGALGFFQVSSVDISETDIE